MASIKSAILAERTRSASTDCIKHFLFAPFPCRRAGSELLNSPLEEPSAGRVRAPAAVQEALPGRKQQPVGDETDHHDHQHDADHLIHGVELAPVMQDLAEAE